MNPASQDIKDILEADSSLGLTFADNLYIGREPETPDNTVTIFDTPGDPPDFTYNNTVKYYRPAIQIRVRNNNYQNGWSLIDEIKLSLHGRINEVWNGTKYTQIRCFMEPMLLDWDENNRVRFVTTFNIQRKEN